MGYTIHFSEVLPYLPLLLVGLALSVAISALATVLGTFLGLGMALVRLSRVRAARRAADVYVELLRNTPLLIQMYLIYFGLSQFGLQIPPTPAAVIAMTLNTGAYTTVIFQAGIKAVDPGQVDAAYSLGMTFPQAFRHIILPPAFRMVFPALVNQAVSLFLFSAVASTISVPELTHQTMFVDSRTWRTFEVFIVTTCLYLAVTTLVTVVANRYERRRLVH